MLSFNNEMSPCPTADCPDLTSTDSIPGISSVISTVAQQGEAEALVTFQWAGQTIVLLFSF